MEESATPTKIELIARAVAVAQGGAALLCRQPDAGYVYLPGGHVEPGESAAEALERELLEEAGAEARVGACFAVHEHRFVQEGRARHEVNIVFHVERLTLPGGVDVLNGVASKGMEGPPAVASREAGVAFVWASPTALDSLDLRPRSLRTWLKRWIARVRQGERSVVDWISERSEA